MIIPGFDEQVYKDIAKRSGSKQAVEDVSYMRTVIYHNARKVIAFRSDDVAGILAYYNADSVRIVMVAVDSEHKRQGIAKALVNTVIGLAQKQGKSTVYTRTKDGVKFYSALNFHIVEDRGVASTSWREMYKWEK